MAGQLRTLLARIELSPRTTRRKDWSTAHDLKASLCMEEFLLYERVGCILYLQLTICEGSWGNIGSQDSVSSAVLFRLREDCFVSCLFWCSYWTTLNSETRHHCVYSIMSICRWSHQLTAEIYHWIWFSQSSNQNINCAAVLGFAASIHLRGVH